MSNHTNYNRMYNAEETKSIVEETTVANEVDIEPEIDITPDVTTETEPETTPAIENEEFTHEAEPETVPGTVVNCSRLNIRKNPDANAKVLCVVRASDEVEIEVDDDLIGWYHVHTASGVDGYCMEQYIEI